MGTWVLSRHASRAAPQIAQIASPVCGTKNFSSVRLYSAPQLHCTIVTIHRMWASDRRFSSPEITRFATSRPGPIFASPSNVRAQVERLSQSRIPSHSCHQIGRTARAAGRTEEGCEADVRRRAPLRGGSSKLSISMVTGSIRLLRQGPICRGSPSRRSGGMRASAGTAAGFRHGSSYEEDVASLGAGGSLLSAGSVN